MVAAGPGFTSSRSLDDHYAKHGVEFGKITKAQYLEMAQSLRDAKAGGDILEAKRADGVVTRFHKKKGWFIAFNANGRIRTFFVPNDGERYFRRQAARP
jgi:pyocin large subunit-like protein